MTLDIGSCGSSQVSNEFGNKQSVESANKLQALPRLKQLALDVSLDFEHELGCLCVTDFVAFYPNQDDTAMVYDNGVWEDAINDAIWTTWTSQTGVADTLTNVLCSASANEFNALILNVRTRKLYEADENETRKFLYRHYADSTGISSI